MADVSIEMGELTTRLEKLRYFFVNPISKEFADEVGFFATSAILQRTDRGEDAEGQKFAPYSKGYSKVRQKKGHPVGRVNLFFTGQMAASMTHKQEGNKIILFFAAPEQAKKALYNQKKRNFFALSKEDETAITMMFTDYAEGNL
jgi:hypothetical protein